MIGQKRQLGDLAIFLEQAEERAMEREQRMLEREMEIQYKLYIQRERRSA